MYFGHNFFNRIQNLVAIVAVAALLGACGGGGVTASTDSLMTPPSTNISAATKSAVVFSTLNNAPKASCPSGGITVESGIDTNHNGVLDSSEVTNTQFVCNGINGTNGVKGAVGPSGLNALVSVTTEMPGANCSGGGEKVSAGPDTNSNGVLDSAEVTSSTYICNGVTGAAGPIGATGPAGPVGPTGANGATGASGTNGLNTLETIVAELTGANCMYGGIKVASGLDANSNGVLDPSEVTSTAYVCNGATGATGATGAAGPGLTWSDVTSTTVQAKSNTGYLTDAGANMVTITLPSTLNVGDLIQVNGVGTGGWTIVQNPGQSIIVENIPDNSATSTTGSITGGQYDAVELQYIGGNTFSVLNFTGNVVAPAVLALPSGFVYEGELTWMPVSSAVLLTWPEANKYCSSTVINGELGWRLPTSKELLALVGSGAANGQGWELNFNWSSTLNSSGGHDIVNLADSRLLPDFDSDSVYVTCVR